MVPLCFALSPELQNALGAKFNEPSRFVKFYLGSLKCRKPPIMKIGYGRRLTVAYFCLEREFRSLPCSEITPKYLYIIFYKKSLITGICFNIYVIMPQTTKLTMVTAFSYVEFMKFIDSMSIINL